MSCEQTKKGNILGRKNIRRLLKTQESWGSQEDSVSIGQRRDPKENKDIGKLLKYKLI